MVKIFKNHILNIFVLVAFFLSQITSVNANPLRKNHQPENIFISVMEQGKKPAINMVTLYVPSFIYKTKNEAVLEEKFEKIVFKPITLGFFTTVGALSFGFLTGSIMSILSAIIGWGIGKIKAT